ncbi:Glycosyl transferase family 2 [Halalkaliarchaeum sp. AArc-CO]|uniref:glucosyl-dolichyl phosphate glucuronosyltransferase n=1 Tax=unclassified Halalkaliarchaeum TaxID=2678344 RepID=UPI00217E86DD|nr:MULTISPECIES: glucosyl-dolichyl phosphate glucuronosyltransferase [unclassified Halalkaliarchaeum]MDR5672604.1 glucosyl-dolichyl phosphate glucuronosyltransferase [Halalkaliarchaeum sp. AArc-GB]UWG50440.1 Glycosyl transferase family 2 [Halalkaliarchaeum sp. AArc-CO]
MKVSVVVCTYSMDRLDPFFEAVDSVLAQTYDPLEVVLVVDGNEEVFEHVAERYEDEREVATEFTGDVVLHCNEENRGISYSRTKGAELASGDVVAFIDDDGVAEPEWIETLVDTYERTDAIAVGGYVAPDWVTEKPDFFPEEFYWLVGCTERGFADHMEEVRNTYGSNISYKREVFRSVGGYDPNTGRKGDRHIQAHEAPVGIRLRERYGKGVVYNRNAVVRHKLFDYRGEFRWLVFRSFWQGYSKRIMSVLYPDSQGDESAFLGKLLFSFLPGRLWSLAKAPAAAKAKQIVAIVVFTAAVGFGYLYGLTKTEREVLREESGDDAA